MNRTQTTLHTPETTFILSHLVLNAFVSADINWLAGSRGSITLSFCGVNVLNDDDCKTVPTLVQILAMRCYASNGVVHARSIYRFKACRIHVTRLCSGAQVLWQVYMDTTALGRSYTFSITASGADVRRYRRTLFKKDMSPNGGNKHPAKILPGGVTRRASPFGVHNAQCAHLILILMTNNK